MATRQRKLQEDIANIIDEQILREAKKGSAGKGELQLKKEASTKISEASAKEIMLQLKRVGTSVW